MTRRAPHKLDLYRQAVQWPQADAHFLVNTYAHYRRGAWPTRLKEDFAGTAALAAAWAQLDFDQWALAVEAHGPTFRRAARRYREVKRLRIVHADVMEVSSPKVDVIAALNFSAFIYHDRTALLQYFRHARRSLRTDGLLVVDAYGGPGAMRPGVQRRKVTPRDGAIAPFEYQWEQRSYDAVTGRVDCRIHFVLGRGRVMRDAFRYDWRLWSPAELREAMREAGFAAAEVWCDGWDAKTGASDGIYQPVSRLGAREDWVAYVVGVK